MSRPTPDDEYAAGIVSCASQAPLANAKKSVHALDRRIDHRHVDDLERRKLLIEPCRACLALCPCPSGAGAEEQSDAAAQVQTMESISQHDGL